MYEFLEKQNNAGLCNRSQYSIIQNKHRLLSKFYSESNEHNFSVGRGEPSQFKQSIIQSRINNIRQKYHNSNKAYRSTSTSKSRKKQDIGRISNLKSNDSPITPFTYQPTTITTTTYNHSLNSFHMIENRPQEQRLQNFIGRMQKRQKKSNQIKNKINDLESINEKISQLIGCLREEELLAKYEGSLEDCSRIERISVVMDDGGINDESVLKGEGFKSSNISFHPKINKIDEIQAHKQQVLKGWRNSLPARPSSLPLKHKTNYSSHKPINISQSTILTNPKLDRTKTITSFHKFQYPESNNLLTSQNKFIKRLCRQIRYDEEVIDMKIRISKLGLGDVQGNRRWILQEMKGKLPGLMNKQILGLCVDLSSEERDPFYTERHSVESFTYNNSKLKNNYKNNQDGKIMLQNLVELCIKAQNHWNNKLHKQFKPHTIDLKTIPSQHSTNIHKEDLVRYIYISTKKMLTNRSIFHLYRRIKQNYTNIHQQITLTTLKQCFCYNQP